MKQKDLLTEKEFISRFKKKGFELYKTKDVKPKLRAFYKVQKAVLTVKN